MTSPIVQLDRRRLFRLGQIEPRLQHREDPGALHRIDAELFLEVRLRHQDVARITRDFTTDRIDFADILGGLQRIRGARTARLDSTGHIRSPWDDSANVDSAGSHAAGAIENQSCAIHAAGRQEKCDGLGDLCFCGHQSIWCEILPPRPVRYCRSSSPSTAPAATAVTSTLADASSTAR